MQVNYLYLWPIFNSCNIQEEVKELLDADAFIKVDEKWKEIMSKVAKDLHVLKLSDIAGLERDLKGSLKTLETLQKKLGAYLEEKQKYFPRFYFLPNEDLIEILGDSNKPKLV